MRDERGDLSAYLAAGVLLPLFLLLALGGTFLAHLANADSALTNARTLGTDLMASSGGITPGIQQTLLQHLAASGIPSGQVQIAGTAAPQPWGSSLTLSIACSLPGPAWLGIPVVRLGGTSYTTSNLPPSASLVP